MQVKKQDAERLLNLFKKWARECAEASANPAEDNKQFKTYCKGRADAFEMVVEMFETFIECNTRK